MSTAEKCSGELEKKLRQLVSEIHSEYAEPNITDKIANFLRSFPEVEGTEVQFEGPFRDKEGVARETDIVARGTAFEVKVSENDLGTEKDNHAGSQIKRRLEVNEDEVCGWATNGQSWVRYKRVGKEVEFDKKFILTGDKGLFNDIGDSFELIATLGTDLRPKPAPTRETVVTLFIPAQHLINKFSQQVRNYNSYKIKFDLWKEQLRGAHMKIPQGEKGHDFFARHTLLIAAARLIIGELSENAPQTVSERISAKGGFVDWLVWDGEEEILKKEGKKVYSSIYQAVVRHDWRKAGEDILKHLYQDFIPTKDRHDFGEYYTPDWLAELITEKVLDEDYCKKALLAAYNGEDLSGLGILDPSCGSGTFLYAAAKRLLSFAEEIIEGKLAQANAVVSLLYGFDIHPVAVELAYATLATAFEVQPSRPMQIYLGDALQLHRESFSKNLGAVALFEKGGLLLKISSEDDKPKNEIMFLNKTLARDEFESIVKIIAGAKAREDSAETMFKGFVIEDEHEKNTLRKAAKIFQELRNEGRNGIWEWFIKNLAQPHRLAESRVARIIGNPPWITHNDWEGDRQDDLRNLSNILKIWQGGKSSPQNDLAALFVVRVLKLYWASSTQIPIRRFGFVLPGSALKARAWEHFRNVTWEGVDLSKEPAWKIETDEPAFQHSSSCVIFGESGGAKSLKKILRMYGDNNSPKFEEITMFSDSPSDFLRDEQERNLVRNGATLFPHSLVRVNKKNIKKAGLGIVNIKTCVGRHEPWKSIGSQEGELAEGDLQPAMWSNALLPFRILDLDRLIMPFELKEKEFSGKKKEKINNYWVKVEAIWKNNKKKRSPPTLTKRCNLENGLASQLAFLGNPLGNRVIYNKSGSNVAAAVISENNQTIIENALYRIATKNVDEAYYLASVLNSDTLQPALRASRNTDRHFDTLPFQKIPIKRYDDKNKHHQTLATLGKKAEQEAAAENINEKQTTKSREQIRNALRASKTMQNIDQAVKAILPDYCDS